MASGTLWAVAEDVIAPAVVDHLLLIAAVWVDPGATDESAVYENNRRATREALEAGRHRGPRMSVDLLAVRDEPWNPFFLSQPTPPETKLKVMTYGIPPSTRRTAPVVKDEAALAK